MPRPAPDARKAALQIVCGQRLPRARHDTDPKPLKALEASSGIVDDAINKEEEPDQLRGG
jgi:hypothetical protein